MRWTANGDTCKRFSCLRNEHIDDIVKNGAKACFGQKYKPEDYKSLLRRLRQSCYLDERNEPRAAEDRLLEQYKRDGLALFLGAGVSIGSGIPSWVGLSKLLLNKTDKKTDETASDDLSDPKPGVKRLLSRFDLVYKRLGCNQRTFLIKLKECLYDDLNVDLKTLLEFKGTRIPTKRREHQDFKYWREYADALVKKNRTLKAVGDLLVIGDGREFRRNPQVHAVLTTNADNLLELYCQASTGGHRLVIQVDRASVGDHPNAIPVCHLHGTLDVRGENFEDFERFPAMKELLPEVVFRLDEYEKTIASHSSFVNVTPLSYLQRLNVLFIGTSLDDDNIHRWLRESYTQRVEHRTKYLQEMYCEEYEAAAAEAKWESVRHFWLCQKPRIGQEEERVRKLGVQIVWCDDYGQDYLSELKKSGRCTDFGRRSHQPQGCWCKE